MRKFLLLLTLGLINTSLQAQNLKLTQLIEVRKKDLGGVEEYLTAKGWEFDRAKEPTNEALGLAIFTYNKGQNSDSAESYISYYYNPDKVYKNRLEIHFFKKIKYTEYMNAIKAFGCKLIASNVVDGNIVKTYRGSTITYIITSAAEINNYDNEMSVWNIVVGTNQDYDSEYFFLFNKKKPYSMSFFCFQIQ